MGALSWPVFCPTAPTHCSVCKRTSPPKPNTCWFHLSMRLTVLRQMIKGAWTDEAKIEAKTASLDRIKWLLWHGNATDAIDDAEYLADDGSEENPSSTPLRKLAVTLGEFTTD